jgi:membrane protease YdiL (CAAX protease family)
MPSIAKYTLVVLGIFAFWIGSNELFLKGTEIAKTCPLLTSVPYLIAIAFVIFTEGILKRESIVQLLREYGFRPPNSIQLRISAVGLIIVALGYFIVSRVWLGSFELNPHWKTTAVKFFLEAGFAEEIVFRGYLFRKMRMSQSFLRAATLSGVVFGATHLINLVNGLSVDVLVGTAISVTIGFLMTFPFAVLFEIGGGSLLGGVILHFAIDSVNFFKDLEGIPMLACLAVASAAGTIVFVLGFRRVRGASK